MTQTKRLSLITLIVLLALAAVVASLTVMRSSAQATPERPEWVGADGIVDESKLPDTFYVRDRNGNRVGTVETRLLGEDGPAAVKNSDGEIVGHVGEWGFWGVDEPERQKPTDGSKGEIWVDSEGVEYSRVLE